MIFIFVVKIFRNKIFYIINAIFCHLHIFLFVH